MGNAFPPKPGCDVPIIEAIGPLLISDNLDQPPQPIIEFPIYEYPTPNLPSFDFGCTLPKAIVNLLAPQFGVTVTPDPERGSCLPTFTFDVPATVNCVTVTTRAKISQGCRTKPSINFTATKNEPPCEQSLNLDIDIPSNVGCDCQVATTKNLDSLSGTPIIDNYQTEIGDSVLVKDQDDQTQNGVYVIGAKPSDYMCGGSSEMWGIGETITIVDQRDLSRDGVLWNRYCTLVSGLVVSIAKGDVNGGTAWICTNKDPVTTDKDPITFAQIGDDCCCRARAATYGQIDLSGLPTVDGVDLVEGDILLVRNQNDDLSAAVDNGCYVVHDSGDWERACSIRPGMVVSVREGLAFGRTQWMLVTDNPVDPNINPNTTALQYVLIHSGHIAVTAAGKDKTTFDDVTLATGDLFLVYSTGANPNEDSGVYGQDDDGDLKLVMTFDLDKEPTVLGLSISVAQGTVFGRGEFIVIDSNKVKPVGPKVYVIVTIQKDYLTCQDTDGNTVYIAKPPLLRSKENDDSGNPVWVPPRNVTLQQYTITYQAYADDGQKRLAVRNIDTYGENQTVDDAYQANDTIFAAFVDTGLNDPNGDPIMLQDLNIDARHWATLYGVQVVG